MSTTPTPDPAPDPTPDPSTAPPVGASPETAGRTARSGVPRWLLVAIIAVIVAAVAVVAFVVLGGGDDEETPPPTALTAVTADVTTISGGPLTFASQVQWNLDTNEYIYRGANCHFDSPIERFETQTIISIACLAIFVPDTTVLDGRDIVVVDGTLTIPETASPLDAPGCPDTGRTITLPPPGTPPGPPVACVETDEDAGFAIFVTAVTDAAPTLAVMRLS